MSAFTRQEIIRIFKEARRVLRHPSLDILAFPTANPARLLVVTPRSIGTAPARNRVRRRLKAIFHEEKLFQNSMDLIIIVKEPGTSLSFETLKELVLKTVRPG